MTADGLAGELPGTDREQQAPASHEQASSLPVETILSLCDQLLGEIGRRRHLFAWLRPPGSAGDRWLAVDGYYPANRLVVLCHLKATEHDRLYTELIPAHGLRLLTLTPAQLGGDPATARRVLAQMISTAIPQAPPPSESRRREGPPPWTRWRQQISTRAAATQPTGTSAAATQPVRTRAARQAPMRSRAAPSAAPREAPAGSESTGVVVGLVLAGALAVELYVAVATVAVGAGRALLGLAVALDACARALGVVAAHQAASGSGAWVCALGGSPAVAAFVLAPRTARPSVEPAPLAAFISVLAIAVLAVALLTGG